MLPSPGSEHITRPTRSSRSRSPIVASALVVVSWLVGVTAIGAQSNSSSAAYGVAASVRVGSASATVRPTPAVEGHAPPTFSRSRSAAHLEVSAPSVGTLATTAALRVDATGAGAPSLAAAASSQVDDLSALALSAVRLEADTVLATAETAGTCATSPRASGSTTLEHGRLTVAGGVPAVIDLASRPAPNTVAFSGLGVRVVLNEQTASRGGAGITVNAVHVYLDNLLLNGLAVSGDIVVASAAASLDCAPSQTADLRLTLSSNPRVAVPGQRLTITAILSNLGPTPASQARLTVALPDELSVEAVGESRGDCSDQPPVSCSLGTIDAGDRAEVTITARLDDDAVGAVTIRAAGESLTPDPNPGDNAAVLIVPIERADCGVGSPVATLALGEGRFKVDVQYERPGSKELVAANAVRISDETGYFWFFGPANAEVFTKIIDACDSAGQIWVFTGGLTSLRLVTRITDLETGTTLVYKNPPGRLLGSKFESKVFACNP